MSYAKAMKHWRSPRKHKLTATRIRGNQLVFGVPTTQQKPAKPKT